MSCWDPIGVNGIAEAQGEYDAYLDPLESRLRDGSDAAAVAQYLSEAQDRMGLPKPPAQLLEAADRILAWHRAATNG